MFAIGNSIWKICIVGKDDYILRRSNGTRTVGATDRNSKTIYISNEICSKQKLKKVLTHEIVHAFALEYNLHFDVQTEEILADFVATYGRQIFEKVDRVMGEWYKNERCKYFA